MTTAREFVLTYWLDNGKPSKAAILLNWIDSNGKLTKLGRENYRILLKNKPIVKKSLQILIITK